MKLSSSHKCKHFNGGRHKCFSQFVFSLKAQKCVTAHSNDLMFSKFFIPFKAQQWSLDFKPICSFWHDNENMSFSICLGEARQIYLNYELAIYTINDSRKQGTPITFIWSQEPKLKAVNNRMPEDDLKWGNSVGKRDIKLWKHVHAFGINLDTW
jgi:hypothetical protein